MIRSCVLALAALVLMQSAAMADYSVWTCYGGTWTSSAITPNYSQAQAYARQFQGYGYSTYITTGARPTVACGGRAQTCLYYAQVGYRGQVGYLGGYTSQAAAEQAGRNWARAVGGTYYGWRRDCR